MRAPLTLYLVALAARALAGVLHPDPAYPDASYYVAVARSLAAGDGLTVDFIWNFVDVGGRLPDVAVLPIPSNAHWMPLAALVQVPFLLLLGSAPIVSLIPFALVGAAGAPLAWAIAREAGLDQGKSLAAGLMAALPGGLTPFLSQPDNFALFMPLGALALWLCARGLRGDVRAFVLGGLVVGLATLARNDGILLAVPFALGWLRLRWMARGGRELAGGRPPHLPIASAVACALLFLAVMAPWYARQLAVFGALAPSAVGGRILWITEYRELFSVGGDPGPASFFAQGLERLVAGRAAGLGAALGLLASVPVLLFLAPFVLWGAWSRRRDGLFGPWFVYAAALLAFSGLLFAVHVPHGTFMHSAVALVPHGYVLAVEGVVLAVAWMARRRRHWDVERATRVFTIVAVVTLCVGGALATAKVHGEWRAEAGHRRDAAAVLRPVAAPGDRLMSADPAGYHYLTGLGGVVTPEDPLSTVEAVARAYRIRWLVLEPTHIVVSLAAVYLGSAPLPPWLVEVAEAREPASISTDPLAGLFGGGDERRLPAHRVYAVCLEEGDERAVCRRSP